MATNTPGRRNISDPTINASLKPKKSESSHELKKLSKRADSALKSNSAHKNSISHHPPLIRSRSSTLTASQLCDGKKCWPIVYHPLYNVNMTLLKWVSLVHRGNPGKIMSLLSTEETGIEESNVHQPREATEDELRIAHGSKYLRRLRTSCAVARATNLFYLNFIPNSILQQKLLKPLRYQTYGTLLAGRIALERGWAINIGGGFHGCSSTKASGFSLYADVTLLARYALERTDRVNKLMIVDLDAHQGHGYAMDLGPDSRVFIMDVFNAYVHPQYIAARRMIDCRIELPSRTKDNDYLEKVETNFYSSLKKFTPDLLVYVAGPDILAGDSHGSLKISPAGLIKRDTLIFAVCRTRRIPIVMLITEEHLHKKSSVVADSIKNLLRLGMISND